MRKHRYLFALSGGSRLSDSTFRSYCLPKPRKEKPSLFAARPTKSWRTQKKYEPRRNGAGGWQLWDQESNQPMWLPAEPTPGGTFKTKKSATTYLTATTWVWYKQKLSEEAQKQVATPDSAA